MNRCLTVTGTTTNVAESSLRAHDYDSYGLNLNEICITNEKEKEFLQCWGVPRICCQQNFEPLTDSARSKVIDRRCTCRHERDKHSLSGRVDIVGQDVSRWVFH